MDIAATCYAYSTLLRCHKYGTSHNGHLDYRQRQLTLGPTYTGVSKIKSVKHKLFSGTMTSAKKIVVEFMLPNV